MTYTLGTSPDRHKPFLFDITDVFLSCATFCAEWFIINFNFASDNLEEDSKYEARVEARNGFGWSNQSDVFKFFTRTKGKIIHQNTTGLYSNKTNRKIFSSFKFTINEKLNSL